MQLPRTTLKPENTRELTVILRALTPMDIMFSDAEKSLRTVCGNASKMTLRIPM